MLVHVNSSTKLCKVHTTGPLPLVPSSTIKWVGFSDEGSLSTLDSEGFLRVLYDKQWRPICSLEDRVSKKYLFSNQNLWLLYGYRLFYNDTLM